MIPKIIHCYCWFWGQYELGKANRNISKPGAKFAQNYEIKRWDESTIDLSKFGSYLQKPTKQEEWAFVSDVVRLVCISDRRRIYMDTDVEVVKPLDDLLNYEAFMGFEIETKISTGIIGAVPHHPFMEEWYHDYDDREFVRAEKRKM